MTTLATDTFIRADQSGWGTASDGDTYTTSGTSTLAIASNEGTVTGGTDEYMLIGSGTSAPVNVLVRCCTDTNAANMGLVGRYASSTTLYRCFLHNQTLNLEKIVSGSGTSLATTGFSYGANQFCWIRLICQGTTISADCWVDGGSEPGSPQISVTDSAISAAGSYGMHALNGSGTTKFDSLTVTDNGSGSVTHLRISDGYGGVFS